MTRKLLWIFAFLITIEGLTPFVNAVVVPARNVLFSQDSAQLSPQRLRQALSRAPLRSDLWLALFAVEPEMTRDRVFEMASLTGGEKAEDVSERIKRAIRFGVTSPPLRELLRADLALIERRAPQMKSALIEAYHESTPEQRAVFTSLLRTGGADDSFWILESAP